MDGINCEVAAERRARVRRSDRRSAVLPGPVLPLSDFGTVSFKHAEVDGQNIGDVAPVAIDMGTKTYLKATTSALSKGKNFRVSWDHS